MSLRYLPFALLLGCLPLMGRATTPPGGWQVNELRLNAPTVGGFWYGAASPLSRGLNVTQGYAALYAVEVLPGLNYTVQLTVPHSLKGIQVFVYDRWPLLLKARAIPLPTGPVVVRPQARRVTYRWRVGVSARSTGSLLYMLVHYPRDPAHHRRLAPRLLVASPPIGPSHHIGHGVTYLPGPRQLVLHGDRSAVAYVFHPAGPDSPTRSRPVWTVPGDLISNARFTGGLKNWVPLTGASGQAAQPGVDTGGLALPAGTGVRQEVDADVSRAESLILWADVRLDGPSGDMLQQRGPGFALAVCYQDEKGTRHCGDTAYRVSFSTAGERGSPLKGDAQDPRQQVPAGRWVRYQTNLLDMNPPPVRIDSLTLRGGEGVRAARVREVHLILRSNDHAQP